MPVVALAVFQYSQSKEWDCLPGFEGSLATQFWKDIFSPDQIRWWAIGWMNGDISYYAWKLENACNGDILVPGVVGSLPGPPGLSGANIVGNWVSHRQYHEGDIVLYNAELWEALEDADHNPPHHGHAHWRFYE